MAFIFVFLAAFVGFTLTEDESKWTWKSNNRRSEIADGSGASVRYEVFEDGRPPVRPIDFRPPPNRPIGIQQNPLYPNRPNYNRPPLGSFLPDDRPFGSHPNQRPDILTGPVPSWEKEPPIKNFDRCKCAEKFNCNSPGISYGQCDVGKQYCCYHTKGPLGTQFPSRPLHSSENGVLVGPGGAPDFPNRPHRPRPRPPLSFDVDGEDNGILVGPGGPTGIIGRPQSDRPFFGGQNSNYSPGFGGFGGPGGFQDRPYGSGFGYGPRSAKNVK